MKTVQRQVRIGAACCLACSVAMFIASNAAAHSVGWTVETEARTVVVALNYGGADPMAFAEVTVTAPDGRVFQQGRADRDGKFAFVIPASGVEQRAQWTVDAKDAEGHAIKATVTAGSPENIAAVRDTVRAALGWITMASVLINLMLAGYLIERRFRSNAGSDDRPLPNRSA